MPCGAPAWRAPLHGAHTPLARGSSHGCPGSQIRSVALRPPSATCTPEPFCYYHMRPLPKHKVHLQTSRQHDKSLFLLDSPDPSRPSQQRARCSESTPAPASQATIVHAQKLHPGCCAKMSGMQTPLVRHEPCTVLCPQHGCWISAFCSSKYTVLKAIVNLASSSWHGISWVKESRSELQMPSIHAGRMAHLLYSHRS